MNSDIAAFLAPLTLLLGAGLFVVGVLSFLDLNFLKTRFAGLAAFAGGLALIVITELMFATSGMSMRFFNGQRSDLLECRREAERSLPEERHKNSPAIHEHIVRCMSGFGYQWAVSHYRCQESPVAANPLCYLPTRVFDRVITEFQMKFE